MSELPNPTPQEMAGQVREQWNVSLQSWQPLVVAQGLNIVGLHQLRQTLRHEWPDITNPGDRINLALLLDLVCRQLVQAGQGTLEYYAGTGDLLPTAPDDASAISSDDDEADQ